jgi:hypothetical protein
VVKTEESEADLLDSNWLDRLYMDIKYIKHGDCVKIETYFDYKFYYWKLNPHFIYIIILIKELDLGSVAALI